MNADIHPHRRNRTSLQKKILFAQVDSYSEVGISFAGAEDVTCLLAWVRYFDESTKFIDAHGRLSFTRLKRAVEVIDAASIIRLVGLWPIGRRFFIYDPNVVPSSYGEVDGGLED